MAETVRTRHKISGQIDEHTPVHIANHPVLGKNLEIVGPDVKPYLPEMHKPKVELPEVTPEDLAKERKASNNPKNSKD